MNKNKFLQKISFFSARGVACLLYIAIGITLLDCIFNYLHTDNSQYTSVTNILTAKNNIQLLLLFLCIVSLTCNKSILKIVWIATLFMSGKILHDLPEYKHLAMIDVCIDSNYCKQGIYPETNLDECLQKKGAWNVVDKACDYAFDQQTCHPRFESKWIYPDICNK